ncbi:hypothetical protein AB0O01_11885 [Streptomyces sp. NPDC093252]|uniref:hypothetical protein n=1 Tax=Streptomyces sp. NPDC093252 TaxID=3154980 RepID=UPI003423553A
MFWSLESELILTAWLLSFLLTDLTLRVLRSRSARHDREVIRRVMTEGVSPVQAAYQRARWMPDAAQVALAGLLADGVVEVSDDGTVTARASAPPPTDPALLALVAGLRARGESGARLYEVAGEPEFEAFRARVTAGALPLTQYHGSQRTGLIWLGFLVSLGAGLHGGLSGAPAPGGVEEAEFWATVPVIGWPALALWSVLTWPESFTPRWPDFNRHCQAISDAESARATARDLAALRLHRFGPPTPPRSASATSTGRQADRDSDVLDWDGDTDSGGVDAD